MYNRLLAAALRSAWHLAANNRAISERSLLDAYRSVVPAQMLLNLTRDADHAVLVETGAIKEYTQFLVESRDEARAMAPGKKKKLPGKKG